MYGYRAAGAFGEGADIRVVGAGVVVGAAALEVGITGCCGINPVVARCLALFFLLLLC